MCQGLLNRWREKKGLHAFSLSRLQIGLEPERCPANKLLLVGREAHTMVTLWEQNQFFRFFDAFEYFCGMGEGNDFVGLTVKNENVADV
jgi:hypothetical protein